LTTFISIVVVGLVYAVQLGLIALSFSITYRAIGFANFAHVQFAAVGATVAVGLSFVVPIWIAVVVAVVVSGVIAVGSDLAIFRRIGDASIGTKMIVSAGLLLLMQSAIQYFWGVNPRIYSSGIGKVTIAGVAVGYDQITIIVIGIIVFAAFHQIMRNTSAGRLIRATADSPELAESRGVNSRLVVTQVWFLAGALAALGGALLAIEIPVDPLFGQEILIPMFAATVIGGLGSPMGAIAGALVLSFGQAILLDVNFGGFLGRVWHVPSQYQTVLQFLLLILVLAVRPWGLFGASRERA
jgi:branched-subunit amino acid ABC-type transport system permease component